MARDTTDQMLREHGLVQPPTVRMLAEGIIPPYLGFITSRPFRRGSDADLAITGLGVLPSALAATTVVVTWEHTDLGAALNLCVDYRFYGAVVVLDASLGADPRGDATSGHTLTWYPFDLHPGPFNRDGAPTGRPRWHLPEQHPNAPLPAPIQRLLTEQCAPPATRPKISDRPRSNRIRWAQQGSNLWLLACKQIRLQRCPDRRIST